MTWSLAGDWVPLCSVRPQVAVSPVLAGWGFAFEADARQRPSTPANRSAPQVPRSLKSWATWCSTRSPTGGWTCASMPRCGPAATLGKSSIGVLAGVEGWAKEMRGWGHSRCIILGWCRCFIAVVVIRVLSGLGSPPVAEYERLWKFLRSMLFVQGQGLGCPLFNTLA